MRARVLLREARNVTRRWISTISNELESTQDESSCAGLRRRLGMLAATCFSTFDVSPEHLPGVLTNDEDFSIAMQCAIIVYDNTPSSTSDDVYLTRMLSRHRRLLHYLQPIFSESDTNARGQAELLHSGGYDLALSQLWLGYRNSARWHALPRPNSQWISCVIEGGQRVHYDLLSGKLLIDGKRLGRLPREIVEHPTYTNMFGAVSGQGHFCCPFRSLLRSFKKSLDVAPADISGMDYMTRSTVSGYQVRHCYS